MPNIAAALKTEIARVARKEVRAQIDGLLRSVADQRRQISMFKRQLEQLQRAVQRQPWPTPPAQPMSEDARDLRWRPQGFAQHRKRLGLTAQQMAQLLGCSALSVYKWESGKVRPRRAQLESIARVRGLTRAQAEQELAGGSASRP